MLLLSLYHKLYCDCNVTLIVVVDAGALGSLLTDDEAGRVKLTRVAMNVGKVSKLCILLLLLFYAVLCVVL